MVDSSAKKDPFSLDAGVPEIKDSLRPTPKASDRISKRVLMVLFGFVALIFIIFMISLDSMDKKKVVKKDDKIGTATAPRPDVKLPEFMVDPSTELKKIETPEIASLPAKNNDLVGANASLSTPGLGPTPGAGEVPHSVPVAVPSSVPSELPAVVPAIVQLTPEQQAVITEKQARLTREAAARVTGMSVKAFGTDGIGKASDSTSDLLAQALKSAGGAGGGNVGSMQGQPPAPRGEGDQEAKLDFIRKAGKADRGYHPNVPIPALSKNEIKTGSFIPMTLETSINSDLPGQITARVTEDVYDSISGCRLLIPALSKVVGQYDSKVVIGQGRMLVVWNSLIFPSGEELNMGAMQSYDTSGQAGFTSEVDNHYWRLLGLTFGMSMITAGVQLSIPQPNAAINGAAAPQTPGQIVSTGLAQQFGQLGAQIIGKYMAVQPTLQNFAGERFVVMVPNTIVFAKSLRNRCAGTQKE